jgi:D-glycero-beta-D-manno-heptose-7-phosphate kinase
MLNPAATISEKFPQKKIVIVGDLVADQFLHGTIARVSREAPVFILRHDETETLAGGAANAAVNVAALGANAVLIGVVGTDKNGTVLLKKLDASKVDCTFVALSDTIQTTTKVRVLAGQQYAPRQQVIRIDYENQMAIDAALQNQIEKNFIAAAENAAAIIISDYNYGVANEATVELALRLAREKKIPLLADSRFNLKNFRGATTATPNQDEVEQFLGKNFTEDDCIDLCRNLEFESLLVTRGNKGMLLVEKGKTPVQFEAVGAKEPLDVTGAGDTVIAAYALGLASGLNFTEAAKLANHAGGIVVMKKGTASVTAKELLASLTQHEQACKTQTTL